MMPSHLIPKTMFDGLWPVTHALRGGVIDYGDRMDPEIVHLCDAMNALPGITTTESCQGHGKSPAMVFFHVDQGDHRGLFFLTRCADRRYGGYPWTITLSVGDSTPEETGRLPLTYLLESGDIKGEDAVRLIDSLVLNMNMHLNHQNFLSCYELTPDMFDTEPV